MQDVLIIGGGPAGLTAASYLCRFRRKPLLIDSGSSRARWIPKSHNIPGFPNGVSGLEYLRLLREQTARYGADLRSGEVESVTRVAEGFRVQSGKNVWHARFILLTTGILDHLPMLAGAEEAVLRALLRVCPICDAFEATGKHIAVIASGDQGDREAEFLLTYSDRITLIRVGEYRDAAADQRLRRLGLGVVQCELKHLQIEDNRLSLRSPGEAIKCFEVAYAALGCTPLNDLAVSLGADLAAKNALQVNEHQQTSVPGLYAAGDIVRGLNQVAVATAEAAIAATDIHNKLRAVSTSSSD